MSKINLNITITEEIETQLSRYQFLKNMSRSDAVRHLMIESMKAEGLVFKMSPVAKQGRPINSRIPQSKPIVGTVAPETIFPVYGQQGSIETRLEPIGGIYVEPPEYDEELYEDD